MLTHSDPDVLHLRRVLRDLVALSGVPVAWVGREPSAIVADLADLVVRRRLVQKMEVLALADSAPIGDAAVTEYFLAHRDDYRLPETISFTHVYFSAAARGGRAAEDASAALTELRRAEMVTGAGLVTVQPAGTFRVNCACCIA